MKTIGRTPVADGPGFALLGPLEVRDELGRLVPVSAPKQRGVLAALLVDAGTVVSADRLADLLWDGSPPPSARKTLENYVSRLRRLLEPSSAGRIVTRSPGYLLEPRDTADIDLVAQAALTARAQDAAARSDWVHAAADARDALALWRGDPFCDVPVERLRREQAPHLAEAQLRLRELALTAQVMTGDHHGAVTGLRRLVEETRIREHPWEMLILALYRCGRKAEAFDAYRAVGRVLRDELGVGPGRGLQRLHRIMLADDQPAPASPLDPADLEGAHRTAAPVATVARRRAMDEHPARPVRATVGTPQEAPFRPPAVVHQSLALRYRNLPAPQAATDPDPSRALRLLSEWNGADLPLSAICAMLRRPRGLVRRDLGALVDQQLAESPAPDRYRLPTTVRVFGRTLTGDGNDDIVPGLALRRLVGWYLRTAVGAANLIHPHGRRPAAYPASDECPPDIFGSYRQASVWLTTEHPNLMTAVRAAASAGEHALAWRLAAALTGYFHVSKRWADWITCAQIGLASARHLNDRLGESTLLMSAGLAYEDLRMSGRSLDMFERALAMGQVTADQWSEAVNLLCIAHVHGADRTMVHHQGALRIFGEVGNLWGFALTQLELGRAHRRLGDLDQAITCHRSGADILAELGDDWGLGLAQLGLAEDHLARGDHAQAAAVCRQTLALSREIRDRHTTARALAFLGESYLRATDQTAARRSWAEALRIFEDLADPRATQLRVSIATLDAVTALAS
ncbi:SARP family transcriptional regulator [Frankia sp. R43]|uniref:BTAD domain-containing putative transcriptional regulator n=1 Tax=Frankia sp. R43 TaxID=269536 RepID=UPI0006CA1A46|nr:BTAD domain-containing putative transcriptional regulator [Frankia sp. R43]KPM55092.1 SARP family transcriptional regulator [Frankia sp. R43]